MSRVRVPPDSQMKLTEEQKLIEPIRQRAKDNKSENTKFFLNLAFDSLEKLRNILFLISFAVISFQSTKQIPVSSNLELMTSLALGTLSYLFSYFFFLDRAKYYSKLEVNLMTIFLTKKEYIKKVENEEKIRSDFLKTEIWPTLALVLVILQLLFLFLGIEKTAG